MTLVALSLGSNIDREKNIEIALREISKEYGDLELSPIYETASVGFEGPPFLNLVVAFHSDDGLSSIRDFLRSIEISAGRVREGKKTYDNRILDIDVILYGDAVLHDQDINIPRDEITRFAYVLKPLSDLYPDMVHPLTGVSYRAMWADFDQGIQPIQLLENGLSMRS